MLHLVLKPESDERTNCLRGWLVADRIQKLEHLFIDVIPIRYCLLNRRTRFGAAFGALDARTKAFIVRVEVKEKLLRINTVTCQVGLQHSLKKPRRVPDVPARR